MDVRVVDPSVRSNVQSQVLATRQWNVWKFLERLTSDQSAMEHVNNWFRFTWRKLPAGQKSFERFYETRWSILLAAVTRASLRVCQLTTYTRVYPKVSGLDAWSENCKWYSCLPSCIAILWVSLVSFTAIPLCVASQRVFIIVVYFVIDSVRKLLDTPSYNSLLVQSSSAKSCRFLDTRAWLGSVMAYVRAVVPWGHPCSRSFTDAHRLP
jgi:hypothetical protein